MLQIFTSRGCRLLKSLTASQNHSLQDLLERGNFDPNSTVFGRLNLPAAAPGMKVHPGATESFDSRKNVRLENSWTVKQMQQLNLETELQRRESEVDSSTWASAGGVHENSKKALMDLHQKLGIQSMQSSEVVCQHSTSSSKGRETFWPVFEQQTSNFPLNHFPNEEVHENYLFPEGLQNSDSSALLQDHLHGVAVSDSVNQMGNCERFPLKAGSDSFVEEQSFLMAIEDSSCGSYADASLMRKSVVDVEIAELEAKEKENGMKVMIARNGSMSGSEDNVQVETALECGDLRSSIHSRHNSLSTDGSSRLNGYEVGLDKSVDDVFIDRSPSMLAKGLDKVSQKCPPVPKVSSSQDVVSDENSLAFVKQNSSTSLATSDEGRQETAAHLRAMRSIETEASGKKDACFRRTSSCDCAEASFIEILKKPVLRGTEADPSEGVAQAGRSGKKGKEEDRLILLF
ncbi:uncharacterized protein LOC120140272 isoform X2 [Hibiscus syriacus]|uniref:uncharacterized protein LOC120140272 isoform X2 n=1 Tax=Hibiscus syriacus TaxID=106335 RepID=UPI0019234349|nr:uncharacterized protein LOC120140272 isoform X2 [Hibiscus syriacus]